MSHFTCLVIIPADKATTQHDINEAVSRLLEPYNEELQVPEYDKACYCIGHAAEQWADEHQAEVCGETLNNLRARFDDAYPVDNTLKGEAFWAASDACDSHWKPFASPWFEARDAAIAAHPDAKNPSQDCTSCDGTGTYRSQYNPNAQWDWWTIGGRWSGELTEDHCNVFPLVDLKPGWHVYAIVTPKGEWFAKGHMYMFGASDDANEKDWPQNAAEIASAFPDYYGVLTDLHI